MIQSRMPTDNVCFSIYSRGADARTGMPGAMTLMQSGIAGHFIDTSMSLDRLAATPDDLAKAYHLHVRVVNLSMEPEEMAGKRVVVTHVKNGKTKMLSEITSTKQKALAFSIDKALPSHSTGDMIILTLKKGTEAAG